MPNTAGISVTQTLLVTDRGKNQHQVIFLNNTHQESNLVIIKQCVWLNVKNTYYEAHISLKSG